MSFVDFEDLRCFKVDIVGLLFYSPINNYLIDVRQPYVCKYIEVAMAAIGLNKIASKYHRLSNLNIFSYVLERLIGAYT